MRTAVAVGVVVLTVLAGPVVAGPWTQPQGDGLIIVKAEQMTADDGFDPFGDRVPLPDERIDRVLSLWAEYGVTSRLTVQLKAELQEGEDAFVDYSGRGPIEIGATWQVWRDDRTAVSLYGGYASGGEGRNAGYAAPGVGEDDWEVRGSVGHSFGPVDRLPWLGDTAFVDVQLARRMRDGLPDETRADFTVGSHLGEDWLLLGQAFGGATDGDGARWLSLEASVVRHIGDWSLQAGWRQSVAGRETPASKGPVLALWRRF